MAQHKVLSTDKDIEASLQLAKLHDNAPRAVAVEHNAALDLVIVKLSNGRRLPLPVEDIQGLEGARPHQIAHYELLGGGTGISFPELDVDLYVPALLDGIYGNRLWMNRLGGKAIRHRSTAKRRATQTNEVNGERPAKPVGASA